MIHGSKADRSAPEVLASQLLADKSHVAASALSPIMRDVTLAVHLARFFLRGLQ